MNHNLRAYHPANFSRHPREVINEIRGTGELANAVSVPSVQGRAVPRNPQTGGNAIFEGIARRQGFDGLPLLLSEQEIDDFLARRLARSVSSGDIDTAEEIMEHGVAGLFPLFRYLWEPVGASTSPDLENARRYAQQFRSGSLFAGFANRYGSGVYFIPFFGFLQGPAIVLKAALCEEANIIGFPVLAQQMYADGLNPAIPYGFDPGYYAACRGYDALFVQDDLLDNFYTVVLNRTALIVSETDIVENGSRLVS